MTLNKTTLIKMKRISQLLLLFFLSLTFLQWPILAQEDTFINLNTGDYDYVSNESIGVYPCEPEPGNIQSKSWVIKQANPGETLEACLIIANPTTEKVRVHVSPQDAKPTSNGSFSMSSEGEELSEVGSWLEADFSDDLSLEAGQGKKLNLKISIPQDVAPGEYGGAIAIRQVLDEENQEDGNFKILTRYGARIYITVNPPEKLNQGLEFNNFEFVVPETKFYKEYVEQAKTFKWDDIVLTWEFDTIGNIFSNYTGKIIITNPQGETFESPFNQEYFPNYQATLPYTPTGSKWTIPGIYKARFEFESKPSIPSTKPESVKDISPQNFVETEVNMTQEILDQLRVDKMTLDSILNGSQQSRGEVETQGIKAFEASQETAKIGREDNNLRNILIFGSIVLTILVLILIGVIVYLVKKGRLTLPNSIHKSKS